MFFVDSNLIIDVLTPHSKWSAGSAALLADCADQGPLVINNVVFSEVSIPFASMRHCQEALSHFAFVIEEIPLESCFLAGKVFMKYRALGGKKTAPLPDFFIGAHALVNGHTLLTRDQPRYKTYFPKLSLMVP